MWQEYFSRRIDGVYEKVHRSLRKINILPMSAAIRLSNSSPPSLLRRIKDIYRLWEREDLGISFFRLPAVFGLQGRGSGPGLLVRLLLFWITAFNAMYRLHKVCGKKTELYRIRNVIVRSCPRGNCSFVEGTQPLFASLLCPPSLNQLWINEQRMEKVERELRL